MLLRRLPLILLLCTCAAAAAPSKTPMPKTLSWSELESLPLPESGERIAYGSDAQQFGELRVPAGEGPFPVVVLIHGGCWLADFDYRHATRVAAALVHEGYAVWTIEYRRLGNGGGWPQTFLDVARAADHLQVLARERPLDLQRVITVGHSAGGQLALWLAGRHKLPRGSELYAPQPLAVRGVVGLAPITDLESYRIGPPDSCNASVDVLLGGSPQRRARRYAQTSPRALLPLGVPQWLVYGEHDRIVTPTSIGSYVHDALSRGDVVTPLAMPEAGHFELMAPQAPALPLLLQTLREAIRP